MVQEIENFFGVYLLFNVNKNPYYKGRTYIGYTVNPSRRIQQHNKGRHAGGAWRTSGKGPWEMVLIIHGFPNDISALRFEWAWQNPQKSRRLRHLPGKRKKESAFLYRLRIVSDMLQTGPWNRLALTIRWLKQEYIQEFPTRPPLHMPVAYGPVKVKKVKPDDKSKGIGKEKGGNSKKKNDEMDENDLGNLSQYRQKFPRCEVCAKRLQAEDNTLKCVFPKCSMVSHILCLSRHFLKKHSGTREIIPIDGTCPKCKQNVLWGDLIRLKNGCYQNLEEGDSSAEESDDEHWADQLTNQS